MINYSNPNNTSQRKIFILLTIKNACDKENSYINIIQFLPASLNAHICLTVCTRTSISRIYFSIKKNKKKPITIMLNKKKNGKEKRDARNVKRSKDFSKGILY